MVGRANGRSITASTEMVNVTLNDATAAGELTADQNASQPPPADCHRIAASGSSTMIDSHIVAAPTRSEVLPYLRVSDPEGPEPPSPVSSGRIASGFGSTAVVIQWPACR